MCCRYYIGESTEMSLIVEEMMRSSLVSTWQKSFAIVTSGDVRPTDIAPVIAPNRAGKRAIFPMKWGFTGKSLIMNARVETAAVKPMFQEAWKLHRCIVPASYYFEWEHLTDANGKKHTGDKYLIQPQSSDMTWLCGLYRFENNLPVYVILTKDPSEDIAFIHDRMPLILPEHLVDDWIRPDGNPESLVKEALNEMVFEKAG